MSFSATVALALWLASDSIAVRLAARLPDAVTVKSAGTQYPGFAEGFGFVLRGTALAVLAATAVWLLARSRVISQVIGRISITRVTAPLVLGLLGFILYAWLAYPPNMYPSNARIHWVDIFFNRTDDFFYALVKGPHALFYEYPYLLKGLLGATSTITVYLIGLRLLNSQWMASAMALSFLIADRMLLFANTAEDVTINVTALLLAALAHAARRPVLFGAALFLTVLGRPEFGLLGLAFVVAEATVGVSRANRRFTLPTPKSLLANSMLLKGVSTFALLFIVWHLALAAFGLSWLFKDGGFTERHTLSLDPIPIDGFTIRPFSGANIGHFLWLTSPLVLGSSMIGIVGWRRLPTEVRRPFLMASTFVALNLAFHELEPVLYFNIRYISYSWPFVLITAWTSAHHVVRPRLPQATAIALVVGLALSTSHTRLSGLEVRSSIRSREMSALYTDRQQLRKQLGAASVTIAFETSRLSRRNYLAYILKRDVREIAMTQPDDAPISDFVFTDAPPRFAARRIVYEGVAPDGGSKIYLLEPATAIK